MLDIYSPQLMGFLCNHTNVSRKARGISLDHPPINTKGMALEKGIESNFLKVGI